MAATKKKTTAKKTTKKAALKKAPEKTASAKTTKSHAAEKASAPAAAKEGSAKSKAAPNKAEHKADEKKKPVSATAKESSNTWMIVSIVLGIIVILLIASIGIVYNNNKNTIPTNNETIIEGNNTVGNTYTLLIVEDPTCDNCQVDLFATQVKENLIPGLEYEKISYESEAGQAIIEALDANQVPIYLFSENLVELDKWDSISNAFVTVEAEGSSYLMLNPQVIPNKILVKQPEITETAIVVGDEDAPVTIVEFTDFECPYCAIAEGSADLVKQFQAQNPTYVPPMPEVYSKYVESGDVKVVFYNYPIAQLHPISRGAHNAALCANAQGEFEAYSRMLWDERSEWTEETDREATYIEYAEDLDLDVDAFTTCIEEGTYDAQIDEELELGASYGVSGTPAFFVGRTFISGAQDFEVFEAAIEAELSK